MYADEWSIGLGGSATVGKFAFSLRDNFTTGSSFKVESYNNEILSMF